eukprot:scaffold212116_cov35-Attheya_sp.AAC.2
MSSDVLANEGDEPHVIANKAWASATTWCGSKISCYMILESSSNAATQERNNLIIIYYSIAFATQKGHVHSWDLSSAVKSFNLIIDPSWPGYLTITTLGND